MKRSRRLRHQGGGKIFCGEETRLCLELSRTQQLRPRASAGGLLNTDWGELTGLLDVPLARLADLSVHFAESRRQVCPPGPFFGLLVVTVGHALPIEVVFHGIENTLFFFLAIEACSSFETPAVPEATTPNLGVLILKSPMLKSNRRVTRVQACLRV